MDEIKLWEKQYENNAKQLEHLKIDTEENSKIKSSENVVKSC